jgi:uncharacterized protein with PIN domain
MNCKELVYLLEDYFDGTMEEHLKRDLAAHIEKCQPCKNFLNTYDTTRILCRLMKPEEIPEEVRVRLKEFVMEKAREHHRDIGKYRERAVRERREQVTALIGAYASNRLSPTTAALFEAHRDRCPKCGAFLMSINGGKVPPPVPLEVEEHLAEFLEALPPGENPING